MRVESKVGGDPHKICLANACQEGPSRWGTLGRDERHAWGQVKP